MPGFLSKLFRPSAQPDDGLSQPQREAIVDVLNFCIYADNHVALAEGDILEATVSSLNWAPGTSFDAYEARSIASAREAKESTDARNAFFASIKERLSGSKAARALAIDVCHQLFLADGRQSEREAQLEERLKQLLQ